MLYATALLALSAPAHPMSEFLVEKAPAMFGSHMVAKFTAWKAEMSKSYATEEAEKRALTSFASNDKIINERPFRTTFAACRIACGST